MASVLVIKPCPFCKKEYQKMFPADGWRRYEAGERVQDCFPEMSADDREFLISGICPTCWDKTFGGGLMGRRPLKWVKYGDIPLEFTAAHRAEIEEQCDNETSWWCYCGRLATGLHTSSCRQYRKHFQTKMEELYNGKNAV